MSKRDFQITRLIFRLQDPIYCRDEKWLIFVYERLFYWISNFPNDSYIFFANYLKCPEVWELIRKNPEYAQQSLEIIKNKLDEIREANNKIGSYLWDKYYEKGNIRSIKKVNC